MDEKLKLNKLNLNQNSKFKNHNFILYLDTSEPRAVMAVYKNNQKIKEYTWEAQRELSSTLSKKYSNILKNVGISQKDLSGVVVFSGPGSFTGLRIGIAFANALAYALSLPIFETSIKGELDLKKSHKFIVPRYGSKPKITQPNSKKR